jgi:peptidoglycan hydrolase-like protein with peptidoglycan-binding domain
LVRLLQTELQRVGCDPGGIDGMWGDKAEDALERFARHAKLELQTDQPTPAALEAVKGRQGRVCPLACGQGTVERDGICVARPAPTRAPTYGRNYGKNDHAAKAARRPKREDTKKPRMCWGMAGGGVNPTSIIVPCTDPRATTSAY